MTSIAICTSIDAHSAVAHSTIAFADALSSVADVTIYAEPTSRPLSCVPPVRPIPTSADGLDALRTHEHVVLVIGDSPYHRESILLADRVDATVILHDHTLTHVMAAIYGHDRLVEMLETFTPPEIGAPATASLGSALPFYRTDEVEQIPLVEPVLRRARGVVVHSDYSRQRVAPRTIAPIAVLALPGFSTPRTAGSWSLEDAFVDTVVIATLGHVNANRQHEKVIAALPHLTDFGRPVHYVVAGPSTATRTAELTSFAAALGVADRVHLLGRVTDEVLGAVIRRADVLANLRYPAFEGASASTLEVLAHGRPMIVCDVGWYAEVPDDVVLKVHPAIDSAALALEMSHLLTDTDRVTAMATNARRFAQSHSAERYAHDLLRFLDTSAGTASLVSTCNQVAGITKGWGMSPRSPLARRTARTLLGMLGATDG